ARRTACSSCVGEDSGFCADSPKPDFLLRTRYWLRVGVHVSARKSEVRSATDMVTARARKKLPYTPFMEMSGTKTTIGVMVEPVRGMMSSRRAFCTDWRRL